MGAVKKIEKYKPGSSMQADRYMIRSFNGYTAQGIDDDWNLVNIPIRFQYVEGK